VSAPSGAWGGILLVIAGIWLLLQTLVAGLPAYILGLGKSATKTPTSSKSTKASTKAATSGSSTVVST